MTAALATQRSHADLDAEVPRLKRWYDGHETLKLVPPYAASDLPHGFDPADPVHHEVWRHHVEHLESAAPAPAPAEHTSNKLKIELGHGSVTGAITLTFEQGKTGVPLDDGQLKAFKNTLSIKANGFVAKLEDAVLSDKLEDEVLDGVKVLVEVKALNVGTDGTSVSADLLTIALKLQGDVGHWLDADKHVKVTLDGSIQLALGGKLAAKLARYTLAKLDSEMYAKELEEVGRQVEEHAKAAQTLERELATLEASPQAEQKAIAGFREKLAAHKLDVTNGTRQIKELTHELELAEKRAKGMLGKLEGKLARKVAWAMEKKSVAFVVEKLAKLVPILNVVSMVIDVADLISLIKHLIEHGIGHGGTEDGTEKDGNGAEGDREGSGNGSEVQTKPAGKNEVSPTVKRIVDSLKTHGSAGATLGSDELRLLSALVPQNLTESQIVEVLTELKAGAAKATSTAELVAAIDGAVRRVRDHQRQVTVDGVSRPDLASAGNEGPVTSPSQVSGGVANGTDAPPVYDLATIVYEAPPEIIAQWFTVSGESLVLTGTGSQWVAQHSNAKLSNGVSLVRVESQVTQRAAGRWDLKLTFLINDGQDRRIRHPFFVEQGTSDRSLGATVGGLTFSPYMVL